MKITKYFLSFAAALGMMTGCYKPELVQIVAPEDVVPPVLESVGDMVYTLENIGADSLIFNWAPADYGADIEVDYSLEVSFPEGKKIEVAPGVKQLSHVGYYEDLNSVLRYKLGVEAGVATDVEFYVGADFMKSGKVYSEPVKAKVTTVDAPVPVLGAVENIEINLENIEKGMTPVTWEPIAYGKRTEITYSIEVALPGDEEGRQTVVSGIKKAKVDLAFKDLNGTLLYGLEIEPNTKTDVNFYVAANIGGYAKVYSEPVLANVEVTNAEKEYPKLYIVGSYNNWAHDATNQFIFDFAEEDKVYQGLIDFGAEHSANEFKITAGGWGNQEHSKSSGTAEGLTILVAGGGDNINTYQAKRYYHLTFDRTDAANITLNADFSFDNVGVVGSFNGWNQAENVEMTFHAGKQRFYADVDFTEDAEFKFNMDKDWAVSYGTGSDGNLTSSNGGNIKAPAGKYRIYLNMNNAEKITYELNASAYGTDENAGTPPPTEPEPEPEPALEGWGLVGGFTGWADGADVMLASDGKYLVAKGVALEGELKFRKDGAWDVNFGLAEGASFEADAEMTLVQNGGNLNVPAGTYDVYLEAETGKAWFITDGSYPGGGSAPVESEWGLIGSLEACGNWNTNVKLYEDGEFYSAKGVEFKANDSFKFRKGETWGVELTYEGQITIDAKLDLIDGAGGKQNSTIAEGGSFDVYLAKDLTCFYVMTPGKTPTDAGEAQKVYVDPSADTFVVGFSGSAVGWDDPSFDTNDRAAFVSKNVTDETTFAGTYEFKLEGLVVAENDELKLRINGQWIGVGNAAVEGLTVTGTDNFVAGEAGTYTAVITFAWDGGTHSDVKIVFSK